MDGYGIGRGFAAHPRDSRHCGMVLATVIGILMVPVTFSVVEYLSHRLRKGGRGTSMDTPPEPEAKAEGAPVLAHEAQEGQA